MAKEFTFGVEEEYQLIDPVTGAMRSRSRDMLGTDWTGDLRKEMQESTVEIGSPPCSSAQELRAELSRLRFQTAAAAASLDLEIVAAGTHPFTRWEGQKITADERYVQIEEQYFVDLLLRAGAIRDEKNLYWSIRPHPTYPTLEFRVTDCCLRVDDAVAIATLTRMLVIGLAEGILGDDASPAFSPAAEHALISANEWRAARYGLEAWMSDAEAKSGITPLRESITHLIERLRPRAEAMGEGVALAQVSEILERGNAADRMRRVVAERAGLASLVGWMAAETLVGTGMDRRVAQRTDGDS